MKQKGNNSTLILQLKKAIGSDSSDLREGKKLLINLAQKKLDKFNIQTLKDKSEKAELQVIDIFSGAGGMSAGFAAVSQVIPSFKIIGSCDINPDAAKTFERNFHVPAVVEDVRNLRKKKSLDSFLKKINYDKKKPLIIIGCAPCQGFTSHRKKNWGITDERNNLLEYFASVAVSLKPECIVMENVPEIFSAKYKEYFKKTERLLQDAGYIVHKNIHNTAEFGVPQERFRMLIIAMRKDFLLPSPIYKRNQFKSVRDAIGDLDSVSAGETCVNDAYHRSACHKPGTISVIKAVPKNGGSRPAGVGPKCLDRTNGYQDVYGRLYWDKPSITITQYARNPASGRYIHPEQDRGLTIREAACLQSFPRGFEFYGKFDSMFKQIGEAVPPKFACAVAANVLIELLSAPPKNEEKTIQNNYITQPVSNSFSSVIAGIKNR